MLQYNPEISDIKPYDSNDNSFYNLNDNNITNDNNTILRPFS